MLALLALLWAPPAAPAAAAPVDYAFQVDPRVEFVSALIRTGGKKTSATRYETEAAEFLAPFASDPAVAAAAASADADPHANLPMQRALGAQPADERVSALYARSRFDRFAATHAELYRRLAGEEKKKAAADVSPEAVAKYLGGLGGRYRFILAPLLDEKHETEFQVPAATPTWVWVHAPHEDLSFGFAGFGNSVGHELAHTVVNPLVLAGPEPAGAPPKGCNDNTGASWKGCMLEHVVYAVTLRALALEKGQAAADRWLKTLTPRGFPLLPALCERLRDYESDRKRYPTLAAFYPRLAPVFTESRP